MTKRHIVLITSLPEHMPQIPVSIGESLVCCLSIGTTYLKLDLYTSRTKVKEKNTLKRVNPKKYVTKVAK